MPKEPSSVFDIRPEPETLQFLLQVAEVANSSLDLDELLERIADVIRQAVDYEMLAILLLEESTQELVCRYCAASAEELVERIFEEAHRWAAWQEPADDRTVVVLKVGENSPEGAAPCA